MKIGNKTWFSPIRYKEKYAETNFAYYLYIKKYGQYFPHRKIGPAIIQVETLRFFKKGNEYRINGPSWIFSSRKRHYTDIRRPLGVSEELYWNK